MTTNPSSGPGLTRRTMLTAAGVAGATLAVAAATPASAAPATIFPARDPRIRSLSDFLQRMTDAYPALATQPRLPQSYADELGLFSTASVYDSALAVCAAIAANRRSLATTIADGLVFAQSNDPVYDDGRLRQGYNVGPYTFYDGSLTHSDSCCRMGRQTSGSSSASSARLWVTWRGPASRSCRRPS